MKTRALPGPPLSFLTIDTIGPSLICIATAAKTDPPNSGKSEDTADVINQMLNHVEFILQF